MAQAVEERFGGEIPVELDDFVTLPGVGRKTGNVVRSVWFHEPGLPVDTHVTRLSARLKLTDETDPVKIEHDLGAHGAAGGVGRLRCGYRARPQGVRRPPPALRRVRAGRRLPVGRQGPVQECRRAPAPAD